MSLMRIRLNCESIYCWYSITTRDDAASNKMLHCSITLSLFQYVHDGGDTTLDSLVLVARTVGLEWPDKDKTSIPATLEVKITPVNDAIPTLVNNTGLQVWAGSSVVLSNSELGAEDRDSEDTSLTFSISSPHCGMVSLASRPSYPVSKFTQHQLKSNQVIFTHTGKPGAGARHLSSLYLSPNYLQTN